MYSKPSHVNITMVAGRRRGGYSQVPLKTKGIPGKNAEKNFMDFVLLDLYDTVMPQSVGWFTAAAHAFFGAYFFVLLMNVGAASLTPVCTVTAAGIADANCEYTTPITDADDIRYGWFPNYSANHLSLVALAFAVTATVHGIFSALGQTDFTVQAVLGKFVSSFLNKGEGRAYLRTVAVFVAVLLGNFLGMLSSGWLMGTFGRYSVPEKPYKVIGTGLGGPGLSYSGELLDSGLVVWGFIIVGTLSTLFKLVLYSETQAARSEGDAASVSKTVPGGRSPAMGGRSYGFLSHFQHAIAMGVCHAAIVLFLGQYHGTAGLDIGRDAFNLFFRNMNIANAPPVDDPGLTGPKVLYIGLGFLAWFVGLALHLAMGFIRKQDRLMTEGRGLFKN